MNQRIAVLLNAGAGSSSDDLIATIQEGFRSAGAEARIFLIRGDTEITELAQRLIPQGYSAIVAAGGDGTVSAVASQLAKSGVPLGVLPVGTLNHFAKDLSIPLTLPEAIQTIVEGHIVAVDLGEVNGQHFINNSSIGLYPRLVRHRLHYQSRFGIHKWVALALAAVTAIRKSRLFTLTISTEERQVSAETPFVFIGNNEYEVEGTGMGSRTDLTNAHLSLFIAHKSTRFRLITLAFHALKGSLKQQRDFDAYAVKEVTIQSRKRSLDVSLDGEIKVIPTPLHYRIHREALKVIVPKPE